MKKVIWSVIAASLLSGCIAKVTIDEAEKSPKAVNPEADFKMIPVQGMAWSKRLYESMTNVPVVTIDGCEYLASYVNGHFGSVVYTHKGNCTNWCHMYKNPDMFK